MSILQFNNAPVIQAMHSRMQYLVDRQNVIATNIAHANTSGYKAKDIMPPEFKELLASKDRKIGLSVTSDMHRRGTQGFTTNYEAVLDRTATDESPDGNNVVLETQALKLAETTHHYQQATQIYKKMSALMKLAVENRG